MKPPRIERASLFFSNNCKKTQLKSCCAINVLLVSEIQNFQKTKEKNYNFVFPHKKSRNLRTLKLQKQLLKNYCWLWTKKVTNFKAYKKRLPNFWAQIFGLNFGPAPSIKIEVQTHFDSIWLYPFSWMFSLWLYFYFLSGCHILIEKSAIFITKMQFLSLEDITLQFLKKQERRKEKLLKTTKMLHYLFTYFVSQNRTNFL